MWQSNTQASSLDEYFFCCIYILIQNINIQMDWIFHWNHGLSKTTLLTWLSSISIIRNQILTKHVWIESLSERKSHLERIILKYTSSRWNSFFVDHDSSILQIILRYNRDFVLNYSRQKKKQKVRLTSIMLSFFLLLPRANSL